MIELDVRDHGDLGCEEPDRAVRLVALDDEPALSRAGVPTQLRHDASDDPRRVVAELAQDVRDHRGRRRLAVSAAYHDRAAKRHELREELGARATMDTARVRRRDDDLEVGGRRPARRRGRRRSPRPPRGRSSRARPSREPRRPTRARSSRRRTARPRRSRRSRSADPRVAARSSPGPGKRQELVGDDVGRIRLRERLHRVAHPRETSGIAEELPHQRGHAREVGLIDDDRSAAVGEVPGVERLMIAGRVRVRARGSPAFPRRRAPRRSHPLARSRARRPRAPRRSGPSRGRARSPRAARALAPLRSRAHRRREGPQGRAHRRLRRRTR